METKEEINDKVKEDLGKKNIIISGEDFERPWGGFFIISEESLKNFLSNYFTGVDLPSGFSNLNISPKVLVVAPEKELSWQVHGRRSELWRVIKGPVGVFAGPTDIQPKEMAVYDDEDFVELKLGTRHRLVGMKNWGIVAEIWIHEFPDNPSDENDIRRISDDYGR